MKNSTLNRIAATPMTLPYFDAAALRSIEPMDARFNAALFEPDEEIIKAYGFSEDRIPEIILSQYMAGRYVAERIKTKGYSNLQVAEKTGMDPTILSKYIQGKRPFTPKVSMLVKLCYDVLKESCNKVMLGYEGEILLPSIYAETARALSLVSEDKKLNLLHKAQIQMTLFERQNPVEVVGSPRRELSTMIGERIFELINDRGTQSYLLFGAETPYGIRNYLRQFILTDFKRESPRLGHLMYLAFETGLALDYFIAEDFTQFVPCFYKEGDELKKITDPAVLKFIGCCSSLPMEKKNKLMGEAIGTYLAQV